MGEKSRTEVTGRMAPKTGQIASPGWKSGEISCCACFEKRLPMRMYDLKQKEVINDCDCRRLGFVSDLLMDFEEGRITHIIVPGPGKFCGVLGRDMEYVIPFECIRRFGDDILLVQVNVDEVLVKCRPAP